MRGSHLRQLTGVLAATVLVAALRHSHAVEVPPRPKLPPPLVQPVEPATLKFASPALKQRFDAFLTRFDMRDGHWQAEPLALKAQSWPRGIFFYTAKWRRDLEPDADWQPRVLPAMKPIREFSLILTPLKGDRNVIEKIDVIGTYVPPHNGWAAHVQYQLAAPGGMHQETVTILFDHNQQDSNELPASKWDFVVPNNGIDVRYRAKHSRIEFIARPQLPLLDYQQQLLAAIATSERFRDAERKLCDGLASLDIRRSRWRDHAGDLHTTVREAFPLLIEWAAKRPMVEFNDE